MTGGFFSWINRWLQSPIIPPPDIRSYDVPEEDRYYTVEAEDRYYTIEAEDRYYTV